MLTISMIIIASIRLFPFILSCIFFPTYFVLFRHYNINIDPLNMIWPLRIFHVSGMSLTTDESCARIQANKTIKTNCMQNTSHQKPYLNIQI